MTISLSKAQYDLLTKRSIAKAQAEVPYRAAESHFKALESAMNDVIAQIVADYSTEPIGKLKSVAIHSDGKTFELELIADTIKENHDPEPQSEQLATSAATES